MIDQNLFNLNMYLNQTICHPYGMFNLTGFIVVTILCIHAINFINALLDGVFHAKFWGIENKYR